MRADVIATLAWYKPRSSKPARGKATREFSKLDESKANDIWHYANCYKDMQFGWNFAYDMAMSDEIFPAVLRGDDLFVWRAYKFLQGGADDAIEQALALHENPNTDDTLKALLVADDVTHEYIAGELTLPVDVVKAYEKLFFNVLDRKQDRLFMANLIFPEGRLVEGFDNYIENTGVGELVMKAGFSYGKDYVMYVAGLGKNPYSNRGLSDAASELDAMFMLDGCLFSALGWGNQNKINNARLSMQASKMGNMTLTDEDIPKSLGDTMSEELAALTRQRSADMAYAMEAH